MQNKDYYAVQAHSRSPISVPIESPVCNFLLVIITNWHPISYHFEVIADYCSNFARKAATLRFWAPSPLGA